MIGIGWEGTVCCRQAEGFVILDITALPSCHRCGIKAKGGSSTEQHVCRREDAATVMEDSACESADSLGSTAYGRNIEIAQIINRH